MRTITAHQKSDFTLMRFVLLVTVLLFSTHLTHAQTWTSGTPMNTPRAEAAAVVLDDGKVLVTGGRNASGTVLNTAELYDPALSTWTTIPANMVAARFLHRAEKLQDGRVLVIAGAGQGRSGLNSAEIYNPATGTFTAAASLSESRETFASVALSDGRILVHGGWIGSGVRSSSEVYEPSTDTWTSTGPSAPRIEHELVRLPNGKVLMIGGGGYGVFPLHSGIEHLGSDRLHRDRTEPSEKCCSGQWQGFDHRRINGNL